jgi:nicotinamidase-related amidase
VGRRSGTLAGTMIVSPRLTFDTLPVGDCVLVVTHLQNDFWHPDGRAYEMTQSALPHDDVVDRVAALIACCRGRRIPIIFHNETFRPGHPELRIRRGGYALGSAKAFGAAKTNITVRGTWGGQVLDRLAPSPDHDEFVVENAKVDPFTCSEFEPLLRNLDRHVLILVGIATNWGIEMTARSASERDYGVCILSDCIDRLLGDYSEATIERLLPFYARVTTSAIALSELAES